KELSQREGCTLFMTLLAGWQALLSRYSNQEEVVVGTPIANRTRAEVENLIGFFVNTLALRGDLTGEPSFRELLGRVREVTLGAYAHQEVPFERLVEELQPERSLSHQPLFQVMFVLQNTPREALEVSGLQLHLWKNHSEAAKFDLLLSLTETEDGLCGALEYSTDLFDSATVERLAGHFLRLLEAVAGDADRRVSDIALLSAEEERRIVVEWNETGSEYPRQSLGEMFESQAARTPEAVAIICAEEQLTYAELNGRANRLARRLRASGVGPESLVAVMMERSLEMAVSVLAVLKAGGAYVPLDPEYPRERLRFMLEDSRAAVLLTQTRLREALPATPADVVCVDEEWGRVAGLSGENLPNAVGPDNLAYVIYTSGSTGRPKGVCLPQRALVNLIFWHLAQPYRGSRFLQFASLSFDASFHEMFAAWAGGGTLQLIPEELRRDMPALADFIRREGIEKVILPVVVLHQLADEFASSGDAPQLRELITTGEQLQVTAPVRRLFERLADCRLHNHYGPSESHVVTACELKGSPAGWPTYPPIGWPIANTRIHVLDKSLRPVPLGVTGELYIGGEALGRGYQGRPELTAERFIPDPVSGERGARLYRTGDHARYLPDGQIEYLGRADEQLKIRGYRVEPGEVEAALARVAGVREAVVLARTWGGGPKRLVAYVVAEDEARLGGREVRAALGEVLPEYMIPSAVVMLRELPLTSNGKVDKRALPEPGVERPEVGAKFEEARTAAEELTAGVWAEVLGVSRVGVEDNFFELGGHSLLATQVMSRIRKIFRVELPLRNLFQSPTVRGLVESVAREWGSREIVEEIAETVKQVELLSADELQALLALQTGEN
ncbi:MAG TPA: amino acid adenylation domain-containing protein, partial [Pyrinomonadaceae bacterium]|nr:amino acid adenylation domain-containing protein [Pyrinomonadaceae bacterium]